LHRRSDDRIDAGDQWVVGDLDAVVPGVVQLLSFLDDSRLADLLPAGLALGGEVRDLVDGFVLHGPSISFPR